jgi:hypothetical protein
MSNGRKNIPWFGVALVVIGAAILLQKLHVIEVDFWTVFWPLMMLMGLVGVARGFSGEKRGKIFWGTVGFLFSLFFLLRSLDFVEIRPHMFLPAAFLVFGIAFLMLFVNTFRDWYLLIPAVILGGTGVMFLLAEYGFLYYWDVWQTFRVYWPAVLILFGLAIILKRRSGQPSNPPPA